MTVATKSTMPMMASQSSPWNVNPTIASTTHTTSKTRMVIHIFVTVRSFPEIARACDIAAILGRRENRPPIFSVEVPGLAAFLE